MRVPSASREGSDAEGWAPRLRKLNDNYNNIQMHRLYKYTSFQTCA